MQKFEIFLPLKFFLRSCLCAKSDLDDYVKK